MNPGISGIGEVERGWSRRCLNIEVAANKLEGVDNSEGSVGEAKLGDLLVKLFGERPSGHLTWVDELA